MMTMVTWLVEYWWIPASLLCVLAMVIVAVVLNGRGLFESVWPKMTLATTCLLVLLIPSMESPGSHISAVVVVLNLLVLFKAQLKLEMHVGATDRESGGHGRGE